MYVCVTCACLSRIRTIGHTRAHMWRYRDAHSHACELSVSIFMLLRVRNLTEQLMMSGRAETHARLPLNKDCKNNNNNTNSYNCSNENNNNNNSKKHIKRCRPIWHYILAHCCWHRLDNEMNPKQQKAKRIEDKNKLKKNTHIVRKATRNSPKRHWQK